jgi:four helix bundle protein
MMKTSNDLRDRSKRFALQVVRMFITLLKTVEAHVIGKQVLLSGTSIGANCREAYRSRSRAESVAKAGDCLKEPEETAYWLELPVEAGIVEESFLIEAPCSKTSASSVESPRGMRLILDLSSLRINCRESSILREVPLFSSLANPAKGRGSARSWIHNSCFLIVVF